MTLDVNDLKALKAAFPRADHEFKQGYVYLTEDAITNRIEDVDPAWSFDIQRMDRIGDQTIVCARMTIKEVSREGVGMQLVTSNSNAEPEKGAATDALKRCARLFGIGRYLLNAPKEGQSFDTWLAGQQKALNGVSAPESGGNGHVSTSQPSAGVRGAGVQPNRPTPPPTASTPPTSGTEGVSDDHNPLFDDVEDAVITAIRPDDDPNLYHAVRLAVGGSRTRKTYEAWTESNVPIPLTVEHVQGKTIDGEAITAMTPGVRDLNPSWSIYADKDADGWHVHKIVTGIPVNGVTE